MKTYHFTNETLRRLADIHDNFGPRAAYRDFTGLDTDQLTTEDVEDFIIQFYSSYNKNFGNVKY